MKILILNGYSKTPKGQASFRQYESLIRDIFLNMKQMVDTDIEFFVRDRVSIEEFLYEVDSAYVRIEAGKYFDQIDMVFFEGDSNMRPWSPNAQTLLIFLRMCIRGNKILFGSSFAMQAIVFLFASNSDKTINIVNGINGGQLGDMTKMNKDLHDLRSNDLFLDNVTGDLYSYNYESSEWATIGNAGIHYRRAAEEFKTLGKYIIKVPQYKTSRIKELEQLYVSKSNEKVCQIRKNSIHHYLFEDVPFEFMVPFKNSWDVHPINFVNPKRTFITLADSQRGPIIIETSENIVALQFNVEHKYPETQKLLKNFVNRQLQLLCSHKSKYISIDFASIQVHENALDILLEQQAKIKTYLDKKTTQQNQQRIKFNVITDFHHAGYASRNKGTINLVINNAISQKIIKQHQKQDQMSVTVSPQQTTQEQFKHRKNENQQISQSLYFGSQQNKKYNSVSEAPVLSITKSEIRTTLHPTMDKHLLPRKELIWVRILQQLLGQLQIPGQLSAQINTPNNSIKILNSNSQLMTKRKLNKQDQVIINDSQGGVISTSSPYLTLQDFMRIKEKEEDQKIIGHKKFICSVPQPQYISNYVTRTSSIPANKHKYREIVKDNWLQENFKLI